MTRLAAALLAAACALPAAAAEPPKIDKVRLAAHIHAAFSTPAAMKIVAGDFVPSVVPGWLAGTLDVTDGEHHQAQPILLSQDGRWYFLGAPLELKDSAVPGVRALSDDPAMPPVHLFPDGRHAVLAPPKDFSEDPDAVNRAKLGLKAPADGALTLVEFSDLECPHCKRSHDILSEELKKYPRKVRRVFKNYPLDIHPWAFDAAVAETCAGKLKPSAADLLRDRFFAEQEKIAPDQVRAKALEFAKAAGLLEKDFAACYDKKETKDAVLADRKLGDALGLTGTPTLFVNGRRVRGYLWPEVQSTLDEMAGAAKKSAE